MSGTAAYALKRLLGVAAVASDAVPLLERQS